MNQISRYFQHAQKLHTTLHRNFLATPRATSLHYKLNIRVSVLSEGIELASCGGKAILHMKPNKPTPNDRRQEILHDILDSSARDMRMPKDQQQATRQAVVNYLSQLDRKSVVEALHKLYRQAAQEALERIKRVKK